MTPVDPDIPSTRPYLIRAIHEWCLDSGFSPYLAVRVDASVQVPLDYVKNGEIVLNVSFDATSALRLGNDFIEFKARFGGVARDIVVPVSHVIAIYARENGQGMAFPPPVEASEAKGSQNDVQQVSTEDMSKAALRSVPGGASKAPQIDGSEDPPPTHPGSGGVRPVLKRVK